MMASEQKAEDSNANAATFKFKKFMGNVASSSKLFVAKTVDTTHSNGDTATKPIKTMQELQEEIEILKLQKDDLRKLVQERTYQLDQLKKLDSEHHKLRKRWRENEEKSVNEVTNITAYSEEMKNELNDLKRENAVLQSKQTNNDLIKNKLENKLREILESDKKTKKLLERKSQEKKMLVSEVLKLRNEKQELISLYKTEIEKLNKNNKNNIDQFTQLHEQQNKSQQIEFLSKTKVLNKKYNELNVLFTNFKQNIKDKISNIDSTTNAFEAMINNANIGNLSQSECNKILDNIINSIESMEKENENYHETLSKNNKYNDNDNNDNDNDNDNNDDIKTPGGNEYDKDEEILLNKIESRVLKLLREKALLQRTQNELMLQLQQQQKHHEQELKVKDEIIRQHEIRAKVTFFKKKQPK